MNTEKWYQNWFKFNTRDWVLMSVMIVVAGLFQTFWGYLVFNAGILGPFRNLFASFGFNVVSWIVIYLGRKRGMATIVKTFSGVIELMFGSPVGVVVIFYNLVEGLGADLAYSFFKNRITLGAVVAASIMAWIAAAPYDAFIDAVPMTMEGIAGYFGPGGMGKVWTSLWVYLAVLGLKKLNIKPKQEIPENSI